MKTSKRILLLAVLSLIIATVLFFINRSVIVKTSFGDKVGEIIFLSIPVFIVVLILFFVNRALIRSVKGFKNKKPSAGEGLNR